MSQYVHPAHIPQPPHSAGATYKGLRTKIDPAQIPSPTDAIEVDRQQWSSAGPFETHPGKHVPLSTSDYAAIDQGNSSPKFIRVSTWNMPRTSRLAGKCSVPLAAIVQPFVELYPQEEPVPLVDFGDEGPPRCTNCRAYINPWVAFLSGGTKWRCNLCAHESDVSTSYFTNIDPLTSLRLDHFSRPELLKGTIDFEVTSVLDYNASNPVPRLLNPLYSTPSSTSTSSSSRPPMPMAYVFLFDVSPESVQSGFLEASCQSLLRVLYGDGETLEGCWPEACQIAIISFHDSVHFYKCSSLEGHPPLIVMSDVEEVFLPFSEGLFTNPRTSRASIEALLTQLPSRHTTTGPPIMTTSVFGPAIKCGLAALAGHGGHIISFLAASPSSLSSSPASPLPSLLEQEVFNTDKEPTLFRPTDAAWNELAEELAEEGVGVSLFLGMPRTIGIGSIGILPLRTGGDMFFHPRFETGHGNAAEVLESQLQRLIRREEVFDCVMRVRASEGLRISNYYGAVYQSSPTDVTLGILSPDKAISVSIEHTRSIPLFPSSSSSASLLPSATLTSAFNALSMSSPSASSFSLPSTPYGMVDGGMRREEHSYLQSAVLYTTRDGRRRVRVCTLAIQVTDLAGNVFRFADMDAVVCHMTREAMSKMPSQQLSYIRDDLTEQCCNILLGYRKQCAAATKHTQLVLPEAFNTLPVYTLSLLKSKPLKGRNVSADVRNYNMYRLLSMPVRSLMQHLYPRLLALHDLDEVIALPDTHARIAMPAIMRDSYVFMEAGGIYLIDNEEMMILWFGSSCSPQLLADLFGVDDFANIDPRISKLPELPTRFSTQVRNIIGQRRAERGGRAISFHIARQNLDAAEVEYSDMLVEDQNNATMSYVDYLTTVHKQISNVLSGGGTPSGAAFRNATPW